MHKSRLPARTIGFTLAPGVSLDRAIKEIHEIESRNAKPRDVLGVFEGAAAEFQATMASVPWLIVASLFCVVTFLTLFYDSITDAIVVVSTIPAALLGGIAALLIFGVSLSAISVIGLLLLIGVVMKNAIMVVDAASRLEKQGIDSMQAVAAACRRRFRPILLTTIAGVLGAVPLVVLSGAGFEMRRPLGLVIMGGLILAQAVNLYSTPAAYLALKRLQSGTRKTMS